MSVQVRYPDAYEAIDRALWHMGKASELLIPPLFAAMLAEVHDSQSVVDAIRQTTREVHELREAFTEHEKRCDRVA